MTFHLIHTTRLPILTQLQLEEALLRLDNRNFCLINEGSSPAIVMGISGKLPELIDCEKVQTIQIPIIKRFSGGGTVVVDEETIFITFICQKKLHSFPAYPESILQWSASFYQSAFPPLALRENDYVIGEKKCGGNAQYIRKDRWLLHTSFLWRYTKELMDLLLYPKKTPSYRKGRTHDDFLCHLSDYSKDKTLWISRIKEELSQRYHVIETEFSSVAPLLNISHRQTTSIQVKPQTELSVSVTTECVSNIK